MIVLGAIIILVPVASGCSPFEPKDEVVDMDGIIGDDWPVIMAEDETPPFVPTMLDLAVDQGTSVTLDGSGATDDEGIESYVWTFKYDYEEVTLEGMVQHHTFDIPDVYEIRLDVTDEAGNSAFSTFDLTVRDTEVPVAVLDTGNTEIWAGETAGWGAHLSTDNVGVVKYTWTFEYEGKMVSLDGPAPTFVFEKTGDYEVTLTVEDAAGNTDSETYALTVQGNAWHWLQFAIIIGAVALVTIFVMRRLGYGKDAGGEGSEEVVEGPVGEEPEEEDGSEKDEEGPDP